MKTYKRIVLTALLALALPLTACGDDDGGDDDTTPMIDAMVGQPDASAPDAGPPGKPTPGAQIDRMGRPAVNTALSKAFADPTTRNAAEDAYNADGNQAGWAAANLANFRESLAILDSLDTVCGNQLGADLGTPRYAALAGLLADDQIYVRSAGNSGCSVYLAVEGDALGILANTNCGGRKPGYDVIDTTYSVVAIGALGGVGDDIPAPTDFPTTFPYLKPPQ